jgi:hypothetical protein
MNAPTIGLIALGILALLTVAFFAVFRGRGKFQIESKLGNLKAEGEKPPPPSTLPAGVKLSKVEAGGGIVAHSTSAGGIDAEGVKARTDIRATHSPTEPPPKR